MITIKEIAEKAGVSRGTVDRVLNNRGRVAPEKEEKIRTIAEELGYKPNRAAKGLAARKKQLTLGFLCPQADWALYFEQVLEGVAKEAEQLKEYGARVIVTRWHDFDSIRDSLQASLEENEYDGWVIDGGFGLQNMKELYREMQAEMPPYVIYNVNTDDPDYIAYVGSDDEASGRLACGLTGLMTGSRGKVFFLNQGSRESNFIFRRQSGFLQEMKAHYPHMELLGEIYCDGIDCVYPDETPEVRVRKAAQDIVSRGNVDVVYVSMPGDYSICRRIQELDPERKIRIVTHDLAGERVCRYLREGVISATICQEPKKQGALSLQLLFEYVGLGKRPKEREQMVQLAVVVPQNLEQYR